MTHVTCRLTAKNRDRLHNPTLANRVWATFLLLLLQLVYHVLQCLLFTTLAIIIMRLKLFWTPHLCLLSSLLASRQVSNHSSSLSCYTRYEVGIKYVKFKPLVD